MDHGLDIERRIMDDLLRLAKELDLPLVATNDLHYTHAHDAKSHEALLCVQSGSTLDDPNRFKFDADEFYLKTAAEMRHAVPRPPRGVRQHAADRRALRRVVQHQRQLHAALPVPEGENEDDLVRQGGRPRPRTCATRTASPTRCARRPTTRSTSSLQMGFPGYFLVVADFINWAKNNGIRVGPGRGSGAGSMAAYAMRITDLDPLQHGLIFERFLNPDRVSMPDFDVDFDERRRGEVIRYVTDKYGDERVAQIVTYGTIKAKQALKDSLARARLPVRHGREAHQGDAARRHGQGHPARRTSSTRRIRATTRPATSARSSRPTPRRKTVFETALGIEDLKRQWGVHAAGVIMSSDPLIDVIPIMRREQDGADHHAVRLPDVRGARPDQDGLPGAAQPHDHRRRARQHRGEPRHPPGPRRPRRSTTPAPTSCSPAATRSACSSSTAGRCARCCG